MRVGQSVRCYPGQMRDTPNFDLALGQIIREHRELLGMSRKELAARIDGSESHIKAIESRKRNPTITVLSCLPRHWASTRARCYLRSNKDSPI